MVWPPDPRTTVVLKGKGLPLETYSLKDGHVPSRGLPCMQDCTIKRRCWTEPKTTSPTSALPRDWCIYIYYIYVYMHINICMLNGIATFKIQLKYCHHILPYITSLCLLLWLLFFHSFSLCLFRELVERVTDSLPRFFLRSWNAKWHPPQLILA